MRNMAASPTAMEDIKSHIPKQLTVTTELKIQTRKEGRNQDFRYPKRPERSCTAVTVLVTFHSLQL
jgi:hypothetical protein